MYRMLVKKPARATRLQPQYRKKLEYLYARKSNIDTLIESLERYDRFKSDTRHRNRQRPS